MNQESTELLQKGLIQLGLSIHWAEPLLRYADLFLKTNENLNLCAPIREEDFVVRHLLDSLAPWKYFETFTTLADIGTGGGLPGIPLGLVFQKPIWLIESKQKKARFLQEAIQTLGLEKCRILCRNAKEVRIEPEAIVSRAFAEMNHTFQLIKGWKGKQPALFFYKGRLEKIKEEQILLPPTLKTIIHAIQVPFLTEERHLVQVMWQDR